MGAYLERTWGAFDGDRVVGTLRSWPCELTVPGGAAVPVAALTNVTVSATHRRRGLLTRMLEPDLDLAKEQGEVGRHPHRRRVPDLRPLRLRPGHAEGRPRRRCRRGPVRRAPSRLGRADRPGGAAQGRAGALRGRSGPPAGRHHPHRALVGHHLRAGQLPRRGAVQGLRRHRPRRGGRARRLRPLQGRRPLGGRPAGFVDGGRGAAGGHTRCLRPAVALLLRGRLGGDGEGPRPVPRGGPPLARSPMPG